MAVKSQYGFTTVREMKYSSQHCCDKTVDCTMALYRECCHPNCTKSWWKLLSYILVWGRSPPLDPPLSKVGSRVSTDKPD